MRILDVGMGRVYESLPGCMQVNQVVEASDDSVKNPIGKLLRAVPVLLSGHHSVEICESVRIKMCYGGGHWHRSLYALALCIWAMYLITKCVLVCD